VQRRPIPFSRFEEWPEDRSVYINDSVRQHRACRRIFELNLIFESIGIMPDKNKWLGVDPGNGYFLNKSVNWTTDFQSIRNLKSNADWITLHHSGINIPF
jgi:hypothetical protein